MKLWVGAWERLQLANAQTNKQSLAVTTHTFTHTQMGNFHILSLSESLTQNVAPAMITGRVD